MNSGPRAVVLTQCFPPETHAGANRIGSLARSLAHRAELTVVTVEPSYPTPLRYEPGSWRTHDASLPYRVIRTPSVHPHMGSHLRRAAREYRMANGLAQAGAKLRPDLVWATSPSVFLGFAASGLARRSGARFVWEIRDLTWEYLEDEVGNSARSAINRVAGSQLRRLVRRTLSVADHLVASNTAIRSALVDLGANTEKVMVVPNGVSSDILERGSQLGPPPRLDRPRLTYAGAIGRYQGLDVLLDVAGTMPEIDVYVVGDGPVRADLEAEAKSRHLANVVFTGYVNRDRLFDLYESSSILFAGLRDLPSMESTFPSKPFEYMATGRPVIYAGRGVAADHLRESGAALIAEPENAASVVEQVRRILTNPPIAQTLAGRGRRHAEGQRRETIMDAAVDHVLRAEDRRRARRDPVS